MGTDTFSEAQARTASLLLLLIFLQSPVVLPSLKPEGGQPC